MRKSHNRRASSPLHVVKIWSRSEEVSVYLRPKNRFPQTPLWRGAYSRYKYRAKKTENGVVIKTPLHSAYSESARPAAPAVWRRSAQGASGSLLHRRRSEGLSSRSVDVAVAVWHQFARYYTTGHFAQLFPPVDSLSRLLPV